MSICVIDVSVSKSRHHDGHAGMHGSQDGGSFVRSVDSKLNMGDGSDADLLAISIIHEKCQCP